MKAERRKRFGIKGQPRGKKSPIQFLARFFRPDFDFLLTCIKISYVCLHEYGCVPHMYPYLSFLLLMVFGRAFSLSEWVRPSQLSIIHPFTVRFSSPDHHDPRGLDPPNAFPLFSALYIHYYYYQQYYFAYY